MEPILRLNDHIPKELKNDANSFNMLKKHNFYTQICQNLFKFRHLLGKTYININHIFEI